MKLHRSVIPAAAILFASTLQAAYADGNSWIMANLFEPSPAQVEREQALRDPTTGDIVSNNLAEEVDANTTDIDQLATQVDDIEDDIDWEQP